MRRARSTSHAGDVDPPALAWFATQGPTSQDADRMRVLLDGANATALSFAPSRKLRAAVGLLSQLVRLRPQLVVMEGTGIAGGAALLAASVVSRQRFVVSSGDAVGPYLATRGRLAGLVGAGYERLLCRRAAGWIGWSPYLVGRALTLGASSGVTAPGWSTVGRAADGAAVRRWLGIPREAVVFGVVGSLNLHADRSWCYGMDLVRALRRCSRADVHVLVVGDGDGLASLTAAAGPLHGGRVHLTGRVPRAELATHLAAMDVAALSQTVDGVGAVRYTTKLSEYLTAGLAVVTTAIPAAFDLDTGWALRLPGRHPWDEAHIAALAELMETLDADALGERRAAAVQAARGFDPAVQRVRVQRYLELIGQPAPPTSR